MRHGAETVKILLYATIFKEGGKQMKDIELQIDRKSHVLYSKPCKKEIRAKIALHYPAAELEEAL